MAVSKRALWGALEAGLTEACRAGARDLVSVWGHPDQDEGPAPSPSAAQPTGSRWRPTWPAPARAGSAPLPPSPPPSIDRRMA